MTFAGPGFKRLAAFSSHRFSLPVTLRTLLPCCGEVSAALSKSLCVKEPKPPTLLLTASANLPAMWVCRPAGGSLALLAAPAERSREKLSLLSPAQIADP